MSPSRNADPVNPDSPPTSLIPPSRMSPLFKAPASSPPSSSSTTEESPTPDQPLQPHGTVDWSTSDPSGPSLSAAEPGDTPSTGKGFTLSKAGLRTVVGTTFRQTTRLLAAFVADQQERELGVWAPDAEDIDDVSKPAANIIYRRLPDDAKGGDVIDLLALGLALVGYLAKSLSYRANLRAIRQQQETAGVTVDADTPAPPTFPGGGF
ncbi:hypothetical protein OG762_52490 (plasmid) [Streptomyces sp. NBC_01136]|uniref:hypothetical protein n=1 Tax=Streptomyces sp. NBC_01136 TaxID=2903754 RepID=UPI00386444E8|nr:hypothetical protein OG762_52490 [Streptomyces sp. NBC_01136]